MKIKTGAMLKSENDKISRELAETSFKSNFKFLRDHNGFRRGELHTLTGTKGSGKSSLIKSMAIEAAFNSKRVFILLSEETIEMYRHGIWRTALDGNRGDVDRTNEFMDNIIFATELDIEQGEQDINKFFHDLKGVILGQDVDLFIYDNFTTGFFNNEGVNDQGKAINFFKSITTKFDFSTLLVFHTSKGVDTNRKILDGDDVRGNSSSVNIGSYNYLIQTFFKISPPRAFLIVDKSRYHTKANKKVYELQYNIELSLPDGDIFSDYQTVQKIINEDKRASTLSEKPDAKM